MGLLSELLYEDEKVAGTVAKTTATPAAEIRPASVVALSAMAAADLPVVPAAPSTPAHPCRTCGSYLAWESIYRDGILRCDQCHPAPSPAMIGRWWGLDVVSGDGGDSGDTAASRFAWVPVVFEGVERREALKRDRYGNAPHSSRGASGGAAATFDPTDANIASLAAVEASEDSPPRPPRWSPPDASGWCWGVDADGALHMRRQQFVADGVAAMGEGLAWLGETEEEWRARMRAMDEVWRERGG